MIKNKQSFSVERIEEAYFHFLTEKHFSKIKVSEIIERAQVSRTTFYRYYVDIFDLNEKVVKRFLTDILSKLAAAFNEPSGNLALSFENFCKDLVGKEEYIKLLCSENSDKKLTDYLFPVALNIGSEISRLNDNEIFALKFVALSGLMTYFKKLSENSEFTYDYLLIYKQILDYAQKSGEKNGTKN
ncbi:MAG: TetR/AcrR family transcriptional regulator [Clostridia bacterium]|nr:TetR/AcrR family transcriptional regulator [Clostridia bacterium]